MSNPLHSSDSLVPNKDSIHLPSNLKNRGRSPKKKKNYTIREWPMAEQPREQLLNRGASHLSDAQLLAVLLRTGREDKNAVDLAIELLNRSGGLTHIWAGGSSELMNIPGIGPAKAAQVLAAIELGRRSLGKTLDKGRAIGSSEDVYQHYYPLLRGLKKEVFISLLLDTKLRVLKKVMISTGSINQSIVHPREVFSPAIRESAAAIIVLHNHPSGDPSPSPEDQKLTDRLVRTGEIIGIELLDHLIIGDGKYVSFAERGLLIGGKSGRLNNPG